jgi:hypothetical protein
MPKQQFGDADPRMRAWTPDGWHTQQVSWRDE